MTDETRNFLEQDDNEEQSSFSFASVYKIFVLNWEWFLLSVIICVGAAYLYLRYQEPVYSTVAKILIKSETRRGRSSAQNVLDLTSYGTVVYGQENEIEILKSSTTASQAVKDLKLYVSYWEEGRVKDRMLYNNQPIDVDLDPVSLDKLNAPISLQIEREDNGYHVTGSYWVAVDELTSNGPYVIDKTISQFPATIKTKAGIITMSLNNNPRQKASLEKGKYMKVSIVSPRTMAYRLMGSFSVASGTKASDVLTLGFNNTNIERGMDYLNQIILCYNKQANDDKNEISIRTEKFINERLSKISDELNATEGHIESYKRDNRLLTPNTTGSIALNRITGNEQRLVEANTQIALLNSIIDFGKKTNKNSYEIFPVNVGLSDASALSLITTYNNNVLERNRLLRIASESNPQVIALTAQLDDLKESINKALAQAKHTEEIQRDAISSQLGIYNGDMSKSPEQERILNQIGRQQEIKSGLYLMLLQKREENSISLAATADKGKIIERPQVAGKVSPDNNKIMAIAFAIGLLIPALVLFLINFFRFCIEGHDDVEALTKLPILADVAVANEDTKTKGGIVVRENKNNMMEEVFRSLRTNIQFMLKEHEKTIMFTSSLSGEGKTFLTANLSVSFALLGKKVVLVGLDIRKPRLAELFQTNKKDLGITNLLTLDNPTWEDVKQQIVPSGVNDNLDLLMAGPIAPNPTELISRKSLDHVVDLLKENYDYIIIDTAPVGLVTDTLSIGRLANLTVCVCRADYTPKSSFRYINELAKDNKLPNMAVIINGIDMSKKKHSYSYGYGRYGSYGKYGSKYGNRYGAYYGSSYGGYGNSHYGSGNDNSIKTKKKR